MEFPKDDTFIDCEGKKRLFEYSVNEAPIGGYIVEAKENIEDGYLFDNYAASNPYEVLGKLRGRIKKELSIRYLQKENENLSFSHDEAKGRISSGGIVIDGCFIPFEKFCEMIQTYEGFLIELNIKDSDDG